MIATTTLPARHRSMLAVRHLPLVKALTQRARRRLPTAFETDDLFGAGTLGLLEASRQFDPSHGATFGQFAGVVITRAIADYVQQGTAANKQHRRDTRAGRAPLETREVSMTAAAHLASAQSSPEEACLEKEQTDLIRQALAELPREERDVLTRVYFYGEPVARRTTPKQWGASRLHRRALAALKAALQAKGLTSACCR